MARNLRGILWPTKNNKYIFRFSGKICINFLIGIFWKICFECRINLICIQILRLQMNSLETD